MDTIFKVNTFNSNEFLTVVELERETSASVWVKEPIRSWGNPKSRKLISKMYRKQSEYYNFFHTKPEAIKFLINQNQEKYDDAKAIFEDKEKQYKQNLRKIQSL